MIFDIYACSCLEWNWQKWCSHMHRMHDFFFQVFSSKYYWFSILNVSVLRVIFQHYQVEWKPMRLAWTINIDNDFHKKKYYSLKYSGIICCVSKGKLLKMLQKLVTFIFVILKDCLFLQFTIFFWSCFMRRLCNLIVDYIIWYYTMHIMR
jgi:hypothetical protein